MKTYSDIDQALENLREDIYDHNDDLTIDLFLRVNDALDQFAKKYRCNTINPQNIFARLFTFNDYQTLLKKLTGIEKVSGSVDMDKDNKDLATFIFSIDYKSKFLVQETLYDLLTIIFNCKSIGLMVIIEHVEDQ